MHYKVYLDQLGQWRWYLQSANGRKIANAGEGYHNEHDCVHAITLVKGSAAVPIYK